jgi:DNA-binding response OmpR family regulator
MSRENILIVDDDKDIRNMIKIYLKNENYNVFTAVDGEEAIGIVDNNKIDLIILDIMMPKINGTEACMKIREKHRMPIIFLTAKTEDQDKITGLSAGGDDYITKPFNPLELVARVKANIRRVRVFDKIEENEADDRIKIEDLIIDIDNHQVFIDDKEIHLTKTEFDILKLLGENKGKVFSIEKIYNKVWKDEFFVTDNTVTVHIRKLREKLGDDYKNPKYIKTIWGVGYKVEKN